MKIEYISPKTSEVQLITRALVTTSTSTGSTSAPTISEDEDTDFLFY